MSDFPLSFAEEQLMKKISQAFRQENAKVNLSSFSDEKSVWEKHILDSLEGIEFLQGEYVVAEKPRILDFGTGGGFPALPIAAMVPDADVCAMDSVGKKVRAVTNIAVATGLTNIHAFQVRGEEAARNPKYRESFDVVCARAAAKFPVLLEIISPFLRVGGLLISYRGPEADVDDIPLAEKLHLELVTKKEYELPGGEQRSIWVFRKTKPSENRFPRETGVPKKYPLSIKDFK